MPSQLDLTIENARNSIAAVQVNKEPMFLTLNTGPDALAFARKTPHPQPLTPDQQPINPKPLTLNPNP